MLVWLVGSDVVIDTALNELHTQLHEPDFQGFDIAVVNVTATELADGTTLVAVCQHPLLALVGMIGEITGQLATLRLPALQPL